MRELKVGITILGMQTLFNGNIKQWLESIRIADQIGIDQLSITDHVVMGERLERYPYGKFPLPLDYPWYEPIAMLSAIAAVTDRIRLSTGVLISPLRPAVLLAKQLATLDVISEGRLDIGVGVGWQEEEYIASGIPFEGRYNRMVDQIRVCRRLWAEAPASADEATVRFEGIHAYPRPVQGKNLPIWFGISATPRNCQRIAELGQGWAPIVRSHEELVEGIIAIKAAFNRAGRNPDELQVRSGLQITFKDNGKPDFDQIRRQRDKLLEAGVTLMEAGPMTHCRHVDDLPKFYEAVNKIKAL